MNNLPDTGFFTTLLPYIIQVNVEEAIKLGGYMVPITLPEPNLIIEMIVPASLRVDPLDQRFVRVTELSWHGPGQRKVCAIVKHPVLKKIIMDYATSTLI